MLPSRKYNEFRNTTDRPEGMENSRCLHGRKEGHINSNCLWSCVLYNFIKFIFISALDSQITGLKFFCVMIFQYNNLSYLFDGEYLSLGTKKIFVRPLLTWPLLETSLEAHIQFSELIARCYFSEFSVLYQHSTLRSLIAFILSFVRLTDDGCSELVKDSQRKIALSYSHI